MKLNFTINKYFLLTKIIQRSYRIEEDHFGKFGYNLNERLGKKYERSSLIYQLINPGGYGLYASLELENPNTEIKYKNIIKQAKNEFNKIFKTKEFRKIEKETKLYAKAIEQNGKKQEKNIFEFIEEITGIKIPNLKINIVIVHPKLEYGRSYDKIKTIIWGHQENGKNYSIVYLTHELLHQIFDYYKFPTDDLIHSLIELISDNELRIYLNKTGKYFAENEESVGHDNLRKLEKRILPYGKQYLKQKNKNILQFYKQMKAIKI